MILRIAISYNSYDIITLYYRLTTTLSCLSTPEGACASEVRMSAHMGIVQTQ